MDQRLDNAVDDAVYRLVEVDQTQSIALNKDESIKQFYNSLAANLGILDHSKQRNLLNVYIPVILATDLDGFYLNYQMLHEDSAGAYLLPTWTEKIPYAYEDSQAIYNFFIGDQKDYIRVYDKVNDKILEGTYTDLMETYSFDVFDNFEEIRRNTIIRILTEKMSYYTNIHNRIAKQFGITYTFSLPTIADQDWDRTIDDIGMLFIFQGYPYGTPRMGYYNNYVLGAARISKQRIYFIANDPDSKKYYHKSKCQKKTDQDPIDGYFDKKQCAMEGAYACPICKP